MHGNHHCVPWLGHGKHQWPLQVETPLHDVRRGPSVGAPSRRSCGPIYEIREIGGRLTRIFRSCAEEMLSWIPRRGSIFGLLVAGTHAAWTPARTSLPSRSAVGIVRGLSDVPSSSEQPLVAVCDRRSRTCSVRQSDERASPLTMQAVECPAESEVDDMATQYSALEVEQRLWLQG